MSIPVTALIPSGYKASKLYSVLPIDGTGDFTVVRNSSKTRVNSLGLIETLGVNVIAPDYTDSGCPVLKREAQSTNIITYSKDFSDSSWQKKNGSVIVSSATTSPDGSVNADKLVFDGISDTRIEKTVSVTSGVSYSFSIYLKNNDLSDPTNVIIGLRGGSLLAVSITSEWQRYYFSGLSSGTSEFPQVRFGGTGSLFLWGAQLEQQSLPTSYIATNGGIATRFADIVTVDTSLISGTITSIIETIGGVDQAPITTIPATYTIPVGNINKITMQ